MAQSTTSSPVRLAAIAAVGGVGAYLVWRWWHSEETDRETSTQETAAVEGEGDAGYTVVRYGDESSEQFMRVYPPTGPLDPNLGDGPIAVMIIHGGYWKSKYSIDTAAHSSLAPFLAARGFTAVDVEYRRVGHEGGGWPGTNQDVLSAYCMIPEALELIGSPPSQGSPASTTQPRIVVLGHSAGGTLALFVSALSESVDPLIPTATLTVALAPVADLVKGHEQRLSDDGDAIEKYMGGTPEEIPEEYTKASPVTLLPTTVPAVVAIGSADDTVPPAMAAEYCVAAAASNSVTERIEIAGADHFAVVDAAHPAWARIFSAMCTMLARDVQLAQASR